MRSYDTNSQKKKDSENERELMTMVWLTYDRLDNVASLQCEVCASRPVNRQENLQEVIDQRSFKS